MTQEVQSDQLAAVATSAQPPISLRLLLTPGYQALRCHWKQFIFFQILSLLLVIGYFRVDAIHNVCQHISAIKLQWGYAFSSVALVISGVFLPELAKILLGSANRLKASELPSTICFFALGGIVFDAQYRLLGHLLGNDTAFSTAVIKTLADQFITTPLYGTPYWIILFAWRANRYRIGPTLSPISPSWYLRTVVPLLLPGWCFWFPEALMIYSLPAGLQFMLFALANAAWSLIMLFVATRASSAGRR